MRVRGKRRKGRREIKRKIMKEERGKDGKSQEFLVIFTTIKLA